MKILDVCIFVVLAMAGSGLLGVTIAHARTESDWSARVLVLLTLAGLALLLISWLWLGGLLSALSIRAATPAADHNRWSVKDVLTRVVADDQPVFLWVAWADYYVEVAAVEAVKLLRRLPPSSTLSVRVSGSTLCLNS